MESRLIESNLPGETDGNLSGGGKDGVLYDNGDIFSSIHMSAGFEDNVLPRGGTDDLQALRKCNRLNNSGCGLMPM